MAFSSIRGDRGELLVGLIGSGIQQSRSPAMHMREAEAHGLRCVYQLVDTHQLQLDAAALPELLSAAERMGFAGVNVTHPFKQLVIPFLNELSEDARVLGAVNTVVLRDGKRFGYNTDWEGFAKSFQRGLPHVSTDRVVQFGAGGAGAATAYGMLKLDAGHLTLIDIDESRSYGLAKRLGAVFGPDRVSASSDVVAAVKSADGIVHATHVGMAGHPGMAVPASLLREELWVAEVVYFPLETELLKTARALGCGGLDGSWMAVYQAAKAFELFSGLEPDVNRMREFFLASERGG